MYNRQVRGRSNAGGWGARAVAGGVALALLLGPRPAAAVKEGIVIEDELDNSTSTGGSLTIVLDVSGNANRFIAVALAFRGAGSVTGVTWNAVALTRLATKTSSGGGATSCTAEIWGKVAPATGTNLNVVVSVGGGNTSIAASASSYREVSQTALVADSQSSNGITGSYPTDVS
jgi:hypothetical protein